MPNSDHVNEYCGLTYTSDKEEKEEQRDNADGTQTTPNPNNKKPALWMCYGGGTGFGGYAGYGGFHRKIRVFDFDMNEGRITTYKRVEWGADKDSRIDEMILVDAGKPTVPADREGAEGFMHDVARGPVR